MKHDSEPELRERDGLWLSLEDDTAVLVSAKARFGNRELSELLSDVALDEFDLKDWSVNTENKETMKLADIPHYHNVLGGKTRFSNFIGLASIGLATLSFIPK